MVSHIAIMLACYYLEMLNYVYVVAMTVSRVPVAMSLIKQQMVNIRSIQ